MKFPKTRLLDSIRSLYANPAGESVLLRFTPGAEPGSLPAKFIPMPYLYKPQSYRTVTRKGINLELDISDLVDWHIYFSLMDRNIETLLGLIRQDDMVVDIGANMGYTALRSAQIASKGAVIGFEPSSHNYAKCMRNISLNNFSNIKIENAALGRQPAKLFMTTENIHNRGMNSVQSPESKGGKEPVNILTLDDWVHRNATAKIDLIKMDVEGYEMEVLEGAHQTIDRLRPKLFIEIDETNLRKYNASTSDIIRYLWSKRYRVSDIDGTTITDPAILQGKHTDIIAIPETRFPS